MKEVLGVENKQELRIYFWLKVDKSFWQYLSSGKKHARRLYDSDIYPLNARKFRKWLHSAMRGTNELTWRIGFKVRCVEDDDISDYGTLFYKKCLVWSSRWEIKRWTTQAQSHDRKYMKQTGRVIKENRKQAKWTLSKIKRKIPTRVQQR